MNLVENIIDKINERVRVNVVGHACKGLQDLL